MLAPTPREPSSERSKPRVLLADDEELIRSVLQTLLRTAGFEVTTVADGDEAAAAVLSGSFDAVLADVCMPGCSGVELLRRLRDHDTDLPVILLTGAPDLDSAIAAVDLGAFTYLVKPVAPTHLVEVVRKAAQLRELARLKREALELGTPHPWGSSDRLGLELEFGRAMDSLWMAYQPIVHAVDGAPYGYEALLRTTEPSLPHPGAVLDAATRLGRLHQLGQTVRNTAARPFSSHAERGFLFVNLHAQDLADDTLLSPTSALAAMAHRVVLEITERAPLDVVPDVARRVAQLRQLGFRIAIDDLGAGYSGLNSFALLEPEIAKLDMALVQGVSTSATKRRIAASVRQLCHEMGILVVAEGVEAEDDRQVLIDLGCDLLQGYLLGHPHATPWVELQAGGKPAQVNCSS